MSSTLTPHQAVNLLVGQLAPLTTETVPWQHSAGRILAQPLLCDRDSPPCDVSAMDGYAIRLSDISTGTIRVAGEILPGQAPLSLPPGQALRIVTGAPVPPEAQVVIRREDVSDEQPASIVLRTSYVAAPGDNIRRRGENAAAGSIVLDSGNRITPPAVSALAAMGVTHPTVYRRVRLGILVTGSEVHPVESSPESWELRDSNGPQLAALAAACPWIYLVARRHAIDVESELKETLGSLLNECDALLLTGGVSMGSHDFVPTAIQSHGAEILFHRLPIRPGKPILGAISRKGQPIVALPGNPVSVLVTACRVAGPALRRLAGMTNPVSAPPIVYLAEPAKPAPLWRFLPVRLTDTGRVAVVPSQGSGDLVAVARSEGFVEVPPDVSGQGPFVLYRWEW